jgi:hypothetical protein
MHKHPHVELNARNNAELRADTQTILSMIQDARPKNTTAAYEPKAEGVPGFLSAEAVSRWRHCYRG